MTVVTFSIAAAIVTIIIYDEALIIATAVLGSYALVRGTACYAGHYYNEVTMAKMAEEGLLSDIDPWYWAYVVGFFLMVVVGLLIQFRAFKIEKIRKEENKKKHPYVGNADYSKLPPENTTNDAAIANAMV